MTTARCVSISYQPVVDTIAIPSKASGAPGKMPSAQDDVSAICSGYTSARATCSWHIKNSPYMRSVGDSFRLELCGDRLPIGAHDEETACCTMQPTQKRPTHP